MQQNDILVKGKDKRKVLGVCGEVVFVGQDNFHYKAGGYWTEKELLENGWTVEKAKWEPKFSDKVYCLDSTGTSYMRRWEGDTNDHLYRDFLGIYETQQEAQAMRDKIIEFVKSQN